MDSSRRLSKLCSSVFFILIILVPTLYCKIHHLTLTNDMRPYFSVSTFGFFEGGTMLVTVHKISFLPEPSGEKFGFSLTRTVSKSISPYLESHQETCLLLDDSLKSETNMDVVSFIVNTKKQIVEANCSNSFNIRITSPRPIISPKNSNQRNRRNIGVFTSDTFLMQRKKREQSSVSPANTVKKDSETVSDKLETKATSKPKDKLETKATSKPKDKPTSEESAAAVLPQDPDEMLKDNNDGGSGSCTSAIIPVVTTTDPSTGIQFYSFNFSVEIVDDNQSGLYSLYFHNCANYMGIHTVPTALNLSLSINEHNSDSYLSAGEIPLPQLYFIMSVTFFCLGCGWIYILRRKSQETFKIHYLMGLLIFVKSLSLLFHGINYYFIARDGYHIEAWAVMFYITHLLKGALLFITIVLIGTGWAFIKHILNDKDKKIFMIVIPLQVLANVASIIMEESEEGETQHNTWREVFYLVDLLCCGAILFPVVWSIRHLQDASHTDGKAAINLEKLKLFRHFYVMIVCYIYFTRIIVILLKIAVPFQYEWLDEFFHEVATVVFFLATGYKFRPTASNPYFRLNQVEDDELDMEEVMTHSGLTEQVYKTRRSSVKEGSSPNSTSKRESSHEYD